MTSVLLKKGLHALKQSNTLSNSLSKFFITTEKDFKTNSANNGQQANESKTNFSLNEKMQFLNSKSVEYNQGWNNTSLLVCSKSLNNFFVNNETGSFL